MIQSFSNSGRPHDNAVAESFFASFKKGELYRKNYSSEKEFKQGVDSYITFRFLYKGIIINHNKNRANLH